MTTIKPESPPEQTTGRLAAARQRLSDHAHAHGDEIARANGWTITRGASRAGFGDRTYRDPRFAARAASPAGQPRPALAAAKPDPEAA
jgi:hypothetical protein